MFGHSDILILQSPLFQTLTFQHIVIMLREAFAMFTQDLVMKRVTMDSIKSTDNRNTLLMYTYTWMKGPMVQEQKLCEFFEILENELPVEN